MVYFDFFLNVMAICILFACKGILDKNSGKHAFWRVRGSFSLSN